MQIYCGNAKYSVGYIEYLESNTILLILGGVCGTAVLLILVVVLAWFIRKCTLQKPISEAEEREMAEIDGKREHHNAKAIYGNAQNKAKNKEPMSRPAIPPKSENDFFEDSQSFPTIIN